MGLETTPTTTTEATTKKVLSFVASVVGLAIVLVDLVWRVQPNVSSAEINAALLLGALACVGEAYTFMLSRSAGASIAFIPYTALALVVPNWAALATILAAKTAESCFHKRSPIKAIFNIAQFIAMFGLAIMAFRMCGGTSFLAQGLGQAKSFGEMTRINGAAGLLAFAVALCANMFLSNTVISIHAGVPLITVWRENSLPGLAVSLLAAPMIFLFAWVYAAWGPIAAALIWVPILGYRHTMKATQELEQTNRELLELMIKSIEARDPYTSGHSRRVQHYATLIARALGFSEREVAHVSTSALLHDVGKIHEKYGRILTKEEKLTPDEWSLMREHPIDGANLVATMTRLQQYIAPVRHHHENWDGTGYPDGLAGDLIPIASRIIMFADTIDAMTTARPYRGPLPEEVVRAEIVRRRGEQFDPQIADAILSSPVWRQLFVPAHPAVRGHEITLASAAANASGGSGARFGKRLGRRASSGR